MKLLTKDLLDALTPAKNALAAKSAVEGFSHFWFSSSCVRATNDVIGIDVPLKTPLRGGIRGDKLLGILENVTASDVEIEMGKETLQLKAGSVKAKLGYLEPSKSVWGFKEDNSDGFNVTTDFLQAIAKCLVSVGHRRPLLDQEGVTLIGDGDSMLVFTTDGSSMSYSTVPKLDGLELERVALPEAFFTQFLRLMIGTTNFSLSDSQACAASGKGLLLFSKLIDLAKPTTYQQTFKRHIPPDYKKRMTVIPSNLELSLKRVGVLLKDSPVTVECTGDKLMMKASIMGEDIEDTIGLKDKVAPVKARFTPSRILRVLPYVSHMLITENVLVLTDEKNFVHLISSDVV